MFLAPSFLLGLLAIGVPLWLHRVARANPTQHPFASLMFLEASETQRTAKRTLRYWLLLVAAHSALLMALVLAFAGPLLTERIMPQSRTRTRGCMRSCSTRRCRCSTAIAGSARSMRQKQCSSELRSSDRVMLVTAAGRRVSVMHEARLPASCAARCARRCASLEAGHRAARLRPRDEHGDNWLGSPRPPVGAASHLGPAAQRARRCDSRISNRRRQTQLVLHDVGDAARRERIHRGRAAHDRRHALARSHGARRVARSRSSVQVVLAIDGKEYARRTSSCRRRSDCGGSRLSKAKAGRPRARVRAASRGRVPSAQGAVLRSRSSLPARIGSKWRWNRAMHCRRTIASMRSSSMPIRRRC